MAQTKAQLLAGKSDQSVTFNDVTASSLNGGPFGGRNRIINGDMRIDQRAAIVTTNSSYIVDRWQLGFVTTGAIQCAQSSDGPTGYSNSLLFDVTTADTSIAAGEYGLLQQLVEGLNTSDFAWGTASAQTVTLSFWVKSTTTGTYCVSFRNSAANRSYVATYSVASANTWEYKTITVAGDTSGTWLTTNGVGIIISFCFAVGSTFQTTAGAWQAGNFIGTSAQTNLLASASNEIRITGVQLEAGSVATPFERRSYTTELQLCQRYFQKSYNPSVAPGTSSALAGQVRWKNYAASTQDTYTDVRFCVPLRDTPNVVIYDPVAGTSGYGNSDNLGAAGGLFWKTLASLVTQSFHYTASAEL